jgi:hypothetical protein
MMNKRIHTKYLKKTWNAYENAVSIVYVKYDYYA